MDVIDEKGRLFGVVNVVDALVVLVVLAMLIAGTALVMGGDDGSEEPTEPAPQRYATIAYDVPLGSDGAALSTGEMLNATGGDESYAVTDVYRSFTPNGSAYVVATVEYRGTLTAGGSSVYGGDDVDLSTDAYRVDAQVLSVGESDGAIPTTTRRVILEANVSSAVANAIEADDTAAVGDTQVATVTAVDRENGAGNSVHVRVGVELTAWDREPVPAFDGSPLRVGNRVTILTNSVAIPGTVAAVGTDDPSAVASG